MNSVRLLQVCRGFAWKHAVRHNYLLSNSVCYRVAAFLSKESIENWTSTIKSASSMEVDWFIEWLWNPSTTLDVRDSLSTTGSSNSATIYCGCRDATPWILSFAEAPSTSGAVNPREEIGELENNERTKQPSARLSEYETTLLENYRRTVAAIKSAV